MQRRTFSEEGKRFMTTLKKVLVTGATGHVGSSTYMVLAAQPEKYDVYARDRQREFSVRVPVRNQGLKIPDAKFHLCDLADARAIRQAVE
jgi:nucleoside-diphosphate-sugar epimerase